MTSAGPPEPTDGLLGRVERALLALLGAATAVHARVALGVVLALGLVVAARGLRRGGVRVPRSSAAWLPLLAWQAATRWIRDDLRSALVLRAPVHRLAHPIVGGATVDRAGLRALVGGIAAGHAAVVGLAVVQLGIDLPGIGTDLLRTDTHRLAGWSGHPNTYGGAAALGLVLIVALGLVDDRRWLRAAPPVVVGLLLASSRAYLLGVVVAGLVAVLVTGTRAHRRQWLVGGAVAIVAVVAVPGLVDRAGQSVSAHRNETRLEIWEVSWETFVDAPLLGVGSGRLPEVLEPHVESERIDNAAQGHSLYLHELAETGAIGASLLLATYLWLLAHFVRRFDRSPTGLGGGADLAAGLTVVVLLVAGLADHGYSNALVSVTSSALLGLAEAVRATDARGPDPPIAPEAVV